MLLIRFWASLRTFLGDNLDHFLACVSLLTLGFMIVTFACAKTQTEKHKNRAKFPPHLVFFQRTEPVEDQAHGVSAVNIDSSHQRETAGDLS
jgi:hypothetical protein